MVRFDGEVGDVGGEGGQLYCGATCPCAKRKEGEVAWIVYERGWVPDSGQIRYQ